ncbi:MAG TPA: hypothetical protein VER04_20120 [Polyangiaceae bacterium]|nr:hypothetical protein [Polyangiaceae bacterium]
MVDELSELARETETLRGMLEALGWQFRALTLEPDARPRLKAFWETLGWSESMAEAFVEPTYEVATKRARERFEDWHLNKMTKLTLADLPERYRVVEDDGQGVGFVIANETKSGAEPPLEFVSCDRNAIKPVKGSYLRRVADHLVQQALSQRPSCLVSAKPQAPSGEPLLPTLCPGLMQLTSAIWIHHDTNAARAKLYYATKNALFDWLESPQVAELQSIRISMLEGAVLHPCSSARQLFDVLQDRRDLPSEGLTALGTMYGSRVLVEATDGIDGSSSAVFSEGDNDWLAARLQDLPLHRIWPRDVGARLADMPGRRPDDSAFEALLLDLAQLAKHAGPAQEPYQVPHDLPERPRRVLEVLAASSCVPRLPTLVESEERVRQILRDWLEKRPKSSWLSACASVDDARKLLPLRARLLGDTVIHGDRILSVTDEDSDADDPVVVAAMDHRPRPFRASQRSTAVLVDRAFRSFLNGRTQVSLESTADPSWAAQSPLRFGRWLHDQVREPSDGVYLYLRTLYCLPSVRHYAEIVQRASEQPERPNYPPLSALTTPKGLSELKVDVQGRGSRRVLKALFDAIIARGFIKLAGNSMATRAFGWLADAPLWLSYDHVFNGQHQLTVHCESNALPPVRAWLDELRRQ